MRPTQRVMVLDDEADSGQIVVDVAEGMGIGCMATTDPMRFLECLTAETTLIFLDLVMPYVDGVEMLRTLAQRNCKANIVLMSGADCRIMESVQEMEAPLGLSIVGHLQKPVRLKDLEATIAAHLELSPAAAARPKPRVIILDFELRRAVELDEFVLHFQPQIDIATGKVDGVEALVRWQSPKQGLVYPDSFIHRLEQLGMIDELGWIVIRHGMADIGPLRKSLAEPLQLSLNVSAHSLHDAEFPAKFAALAEEYGFSGESLTLEITETGLISELSGAHEILAALRQQGVQLSIDDFGTGYSMLGQLRKIPATELKIDRSFIANIQNEGGDRVMVQKTIEIGKGLGLKVVAEGVETVEQLQVLRGYSCDIAQGYLFSRPLPVAELREWLLAHASRAGN
jgi:EAL domain-containing protein (putative c-di-GMP-specific phosphodiesterase class I)/FixJ family two-component response regulator